MLGPCALFSRSLPLLQTASGRRKGNVSTRKRVKEATLVSVLDRLKYLWALSSIQWIRLCCRTNVQNIPYRVFTSLERFYVIWKLHKKGNVLGVRSRRIAIKSAITLEWQGMPSAGGTAGATDSAEAPQGQFSWPWYKSSIYYQYGRVQVWRIQETWGLLRISPVLLISFERRFLWIKAEIRRSFITATVWEQCPRTHHKGATGRVRTGNQLFPVPNLCHWVTSRRTSQAAHTLKQLKHLDLGMSYIIWSRAGQGLSCACCWHNIWNQKRMLLEL